jgi:alpha-mannosidase
MPHRILAGVLLAVVSMTLAATSIFAQKRIYIAPDDHTDYMWSGNEATYTKVLGDMSDLYLNEMDLTSTLPSDYQMRWNADGSFWMWNYQQNRTAAEFNRFMSRVADGHVTVPLNAMVSVYGGQPTEAVLRGMYYAGHIEREYNVRFPLAVAMENQTLPYGLGSLWAGSGARYSWRGICDCATKVPNAANRPHEIYYYGGPDGSQVLMKWESQFAPLHSGARPNYGIGGYAEARYPLEVVPFVDTNSKFQSKYPFNVIGAFGKGGDDLETLTTLSDPNFSFPAVAAALSNSSRRVIVSNEVDFFKDFEATYASSLPTVATTSGNEWDLATASLAEVTSSVRRETEKLRGAEAMATLVSLETPSFMNSFTAARDQAWIYFGQYWEHDMVNSIPGVTDAQRVRFQRKVANGISSYVDSLYSKASSSLAGMIPAASGKTRFYAFNPLGWVRTDYADIAYSGALPVHVIDVSSGAETPSQILKVGGVQTLRVLASGIPAVGYKVYEIAKGAGAKFTAAATLSKSNSVIDNGVYKLTLDTRGSVVSLIDKTQGNKEFATSIGGLAVNDFSTTGSGSIAVENSGPVSVTVVATSSAGLNHKTHLTMYRQSHRVDITNEIIQNFGSTHTWAFTFNLSQPDVHTEEIGAVLHAKLTTHGGDYAPTEARYDWASANHFVDMTSSNGNVGVTVSNADCSFVKIGHSTVSSLDTVTPQLNFLAGGRIDNLGRGISQGGDKYFLQRFALNVHGAYDVTSAMRFAMEHQNPLTTALVSGPAASPYPPASYSLLSISNPNVLLWALKPAEEGISKGIIARVWNQGAAGSVSVGVPGRKGGVLSAMQSTHIETDLKTLPVSGGLVTAAINQRQIVTLRLKTN